MSGSEFDHVDLSYMNLNGAILFNCKWSNLKVNELNRFDGHNNVVTSICFSPDGKTLASNSADNSILLWNVKTGQQKTKMEGKIVCFSPDGTTLAVGN